MRFQYPNEPAKPSVTGPFPGALHSELLEGMQHQGGLSDSYQERYTRYINFKQSKGNYFVDVDGNTVLDLNASAAGQVLGYNHDDLVNARSTDLYDRFVTHKVDAASLPPHDLADLLRH